MKEIVMHSLSVAADALFKVSFFNILAPFGIHSIELPICIAYLTFGFAYVTIKLNFIQFTKMIEGFKHAMFGSEASKEKGESVSPFKTLFTAVASSTGLNNTAGIAGMILIGGPGALFWMPIIIFLCMAFRYCEIYLSHKYRSTSNDGASLGGPFDYIRECFTSRGKPKVARVLSYSYAAILAFAGLVGVSMLEINQAVAIVTDNISILHEKEAIVSLACVGIVAYVIFGGTKRITNFFGSVMPFLIGIFWATSALIVIVKIKELPDALVLILKDAMHPKALAGGAFASFALCLRRFSMSTETGIGTAGIVHASSSEPSSVKEALGGMISPIINGFLVCVMTALVIILTGVYNGQNGDGIVLLSHAFSSVHPYLAIVLTFMIPIMAMNVAIGWSYYGVKCVTYVLGKKLVKPFLIGYIIMGFIGGIVNDFQLILKIIDSALMLIPLINVTVVILMIKDIKAGLNEYAEGK